MRKRRLIGALGIVAFIAAATGGIATAEDTTVDKAVEAPATEVDTSNLDELTPVPTANVEDTKQRVANGNDTVTLDFKGNSDEVNELLDRAQDPNSGVTHLGGIGENNSFSVKGATVSDVEKFASAPNLEGIGAEDSFGYASTATVADSDSDDFLASVGPTNRGQGAVVVVIDSSFDTSQTGELADSTDSIIEEEACFVSDSSCGGFNSNVGPGAADRAFCAGAGIQGCDHGTFVAQTIVGNGNPVAGTAPEASLYLIRTGQLFNTDCAPGFTQCVRTGTTPLVTALNHVATLPDLGFNVKVVNMSLGGGNIADFCSGSALTNAVANLTNLDISVVVAAGNESSVTGVSTPGCVREAFTVSGKDTGSDSVWASSSFGRQTDVIAAVDGTGRINNQGCCVTGAGTSFAAPLVSGMLASLWSTYWNAEYHTMAFFEAALRNTGTLLKDQRSGGIYAATTANLWDASIYVLRMTELGGANGDKSTRLLENPTRVVDSRTGRGLGSATPVMIGAGTWTFDMDSMLGINNSHVMQYLINVTALDATAISYISVGPGAISNPNYSTTNTYPGMAPTPGSIWVTPDANGVIGVFNYTGAANLIIDVMGWIPANAEYHPLSQPTRVMDTRDGTGGVPVGVRNANTNLDFDPKGKGGVPNSNSVVAVVGTLTVQAAQNNATYITVEPGGYNLASLSAILVEGDYTHIRSNTIVAALSPTGTSVPKQIRFYNVGQGVHLIFDVTGYILDTDDETIQVRDGGYRWFDTRFDVPNYTLDNNKLTDTASNNGFSCGNNGIRGLVGNLILLASANGPWARVWYASHNIVVPGDGPPHSNVNANNGQSVAQLTHSLSDTVWVNGYGGTNAETVFEAYACWT